MNFSSLRIQAALLSVVTVLSGLGLMLLNPLPVQLLQLQVFDQYQRWQPRTYAPAPVRVVDLDDESLSRLGQWPWPRTRIADMVHTLTAMGAAAVAFDVVFAEPDRTSPRALVAQWPLPNETRAQLQALPDHDAVLADAIRGQPVVLGFAATREIPAGASSPQEPNLPYRYIWSGPPTPEALHGFTSAVGSIPPLAAAAAGSGALTFIPDGDGVVRRVPLVLRLQDRLVPTLVAETLRVGQGERNYLLMTEAGGLGLEGVRTGGVFLPTNPAGEMWVYYSPPVPERSVPAWQVLEGQVPRERIEGSLVLIGSSAQGIMDLRFNPLGRLMPGVEAHAQALEQALNGQFLVRPGWARGLELLIIVFGGIGICMLSTYTRALLGAGASTVLVATGGWVGWWAFTRHGLLLDTVTPTLVLLLAFMLSSLVRHWWVERQQRWIKGAFSRYVSPNLVEYLVRQPMKLELGGKRQMCSFVFTDLAGFTTLMEHLDPAQAVGLLNRYLDEMIGIAFRHQGTLDRIVGDAVAIMFSAPLPQPDHACRALACAMEMHAFAARYAQELQAQGVAFGDTRLGIHAGEVIVGNFGGSTIFDYRALGDPVNTAARLESVNKHLGTWICMSDAIRRACPDVSARPVGYLVLKGRTEALMVHEPLPQTLPPHYAPLDLYQQAYEALDGPDMALANKRFARLRSDYPDDPLVVFHHDRLNRGEAGACVVLDSK